MVSIRSILRIGRLFFLVTLLEILCIHDQVDAQVVVERSSNKAVIGGETYYIHVVKKGETSYSISRAYGITVEQLTNENKSAGSSLREGMSLRIPVRIVSPAPAPEPLPYRHTIHDENRFIYHFLKHGETIYFLSKTYGVSEQEIIESNPGLDVTKITLDSEIAIPKKMVIIPEKNKQDVSGKEYYHKVKQGETLSSIARQYDISLRDLKKANRDLRFPKVGDYIRIPGYNAVEEKPEEPLVVDTVPVVTENEIRYFEKPRGYTTIENLNGSIDVAVLLPFYLQENSRRTEIDSSRTVKGKKEYRVITRQTDWIYPASVEFIEMYEGILLAADTLRSLGLNITIHAYDIKSDTIETMRLLRSGALDKMDLIIGPVYSRNLSLVASHARDFEIPVVSPVPLFSNSPLDNNPYLFLSGSTLQVVQREIAKKAAEYADHNFVLIRTPNPDPSQEISMFKELIAAEAAKRFPQQEIKIRDLVFYSRSEFGKDSVNRLARALSESKKNVVIIASDNPAEMSESIMEVRNLARKFSIKVFGYPEMRNLSNIDPKFFFDIGLLVYSPYWIDYSESDVSEFNSDFRQKFFTEPSEQSYAWQGYDIAYYFLSGIAIHGKEFIHHPEIHNPDLLHTEFEFRKKGINDGFENQKLFLIRYSTNYDLELVNDSGTEIPKYQ